MNLRDAIAAGWQRRGANALLLPVAMVFAALVACRRALYRFGVLRPVRLPVPVIVVGNVTAGGSGKTPLVVYLAAALARAGRRPGIVSRGYGGRGAGVRAVGPAADPAEVGDEPVLLARRAACPVYVGRDRVAAARALLAAHPSCDVLIADDGLQHLRLARDIELVVSDERGCGNGWPLPAGPLRDCPQRIASADALVLNGDGATAPAGIVPQAQFRMRLAGSRFVSLAVPQRECEASALRGRRLHAIAGTGNPARFFAHLEALGLECVVHPFPDHHAFGLADLAFADGEVLLMTEKDAVKCSAFAPPESWVLPVEAQFEPDLAQWMVEKLDGQPTAGNSGLPGLQGTA